ncbi:MAG: alginate export family protein [Halioglobus sp.]|nr:alginate export family protein [Halioglobus sp.]MCB1707887.1 alginate export family protein [Halioglobus sp.]MCP5122105.1 alginate export family protein [Pseudomonadales bacterium]MCP5192349.1 alginate export family protein [Pseudomonadales bacterium]
MKHNVNYNRVFAGLLLAGMTASSWGAEGITTSLEEAVKGGTVALDFRYRFEGVDQDGIDKDAEASTLRSRITATSGAIHGFTILGEADNVSVVGSTRYNSTVNDKTQYPVVADPKGTEINQVYLKYTADSGYGIYGRQRINYSNQRFVGGVAWRQNEQSFDGFRADWQVLDSVNVDYSYSYRVHRVFGPDDGVNPAEWDGDNHFLYVDWKVAEGHNIGAYGYYIDVDSQQGYGDGKTVNNSSETWGLEYVGKVSVLNLRAAYASQADAGDSELDYNADYYLLEVGGKVAGIGLKGGYEVLAAGDGTGFATPLATLHKFQGWADKFLSTPGDGVEDMYFGVDAMAGPFVVAAIYHNFQAEDSSEDFGDEIDLSATWPVNEHFSTELKFAGFSADGNRYTDTNKLWLTLQLKL